VRLTTVEHEFPLPLDHDEPDGARITVFAREVANAEDRERKPFLVFFQGGPGFEADRPSAAPLEPRWLERALADYRVLLLDERGTGRSTPVGPAHTDAAYLTHFRADSIVRDAEAIREQLGVDRWSVIGQSFGGFCVVAYLSHAPDALSEAFVTGGLPPLGLPIDEVYERTYPNVIARSRRYYERYPEDRPRVARILELCDAGELTLPTGEQLTARRFRQLGLLLGMSSGERKLHYLVELPPHSPAFLHDVANALGFPRNPIFAVLHESCYADGTLTNWAAERLLPADVYEQEPTLFTGEHIFPWMFEDYAALRPFRDVAATLARQPWPQLYDAAQLEVNDVPAAAIVYANDMYVPRELSEATAARIRNLHVWLSNEWEHDGLHVDPVRILDRLIGLVRGNV
jgi:pimeloyl-ACP methyl ester carboxylesterase